MTAEPAPLTFVAENVDGARHTLTLVGWTLAGRARLVSDGAASYEADPGSGAVLGVDGQAGIVLRLVPSAWRRLKAAHRARLLEERCPRCRSPHAGLYVSETGVTHCGCYTLSDDQARDTLLLRLEQTLASEEERVAVRLRDLRALVDALALTLADPAPPGPAAGQQVAHAAADLAAFVARLDALRRARLPG